MNMILGDVEETITVVDVDEITQAQSLRVSHVSPVNELRADKSRTDGQEELRNAVCTSFSLY